MGKLTKALEAGIFSEFETDESKEDTSTADKKEVVKNEDPTLKSNKDEINKAYEILGL